MDDNKFVKLFRAAERPGLYCRVIQPGVVRAGAAVTHTPTTGPTIGIVEMFRNYYLPEWDAATRDRELAAPIAIRARQDALEKPLI
jgi:MOSC domain-containing protein YiiM